MILQRLLLKSLLLAIVAASLITAVIPTRAADQTVGNVTNVTLSVDGTNGNVTANFWIDNGGEAAARRR
jgi:hypothetical protein